MPTPTLARKGTVKGAPPQASAKSRFTEQRPAVLWLAAAATFGAAAGGWLVSSLQVPAITGTPPNTPSMVDLATAVELRREAAAACNTQQWGACVANLEKARGVDPGGDDTPTAKILRDTAIAELLKKP
jgi:hypothetical protein